MYNQQMAEDFIQAAELDNLVPEKASDQALADAIRREIAVIKTTSQE